MAKNIYDLFNERKYGVDYLVEGYEFDNVDAADYENLEESIAALNEFTMESMNETIEMQAAFYLEDLVIENMMYTDFNEEKIQTVMEGSVKDKFQAAKDKIKHWWEKMKAWFKGTFKAIVNHFKSGETLVRENGKKIDEAMKKSHLKVKMPKYFDLDVGMDDVQDLLDKLKEAGTTDAEKEDARAAILKHVNASDKKDVADSIKEFFIDEENVEQAISSIDIAIAKKYAGESKKIINNLKKQEKKVDESFRKALQKLQEAERKATGEAVAPAERTVANFNFALGIKNIVLSTQMSIIRKACNDYTTVIRRALNAPANKKAEKKHLKEVEMESVVPTFDDDIEFY